VKRRALERLLREAGAIVKREGGETYDLDESEDGTEIICSPSRRDKETYRARHL